MHLQSFWHQFAAEQGNEPGAHQGDVIVTFTQPIGGESEVTVPSDNVSIAAEAGNLLGVQVKLLDGRLLFAMSGAVAGIVDAPLSAEEAKRRGVRQDRAERAAADADAQREAQDEELEARVPAANRTEEQQEHAAERERAAKAEQDEAAAESDREERERAAKAERAGGKGSAKAVNDAGSGSEGVTQDDQSRAEAANPSAADEIHAAAHDKAEAAHDKSEAAADKATASRRRPGR